MPQTCAYFACPFVLRLCRTQVQGAGSLHSPIQVSSHVQSERVNQFVLNIYNILRWVKVFSDYESSWFCLSQNGACPLYYLTRSCPCCFVGIRVARDAYLAVDGLASQGGIIFGGQEGNP